MKQIEAGIYYVTGDKIPIQILVTKELSEEGNLWLRSLTNQLKEKEAERLIEEYKNYKDNLLYQSMMDVFRAIADKEYQRKII